MRAAIIGAAPVRSYLPGQVCEVDTFWEQRIKTARSLPNDRFAPLTSAGLSTMHSGSIPRQNCTPRKVGQSRSLARAPRFGSFIVDGSGERQINFCDLNRGDRNCSVMPGCGPGEEAI